MHGAKWLPLAAAAWMAAGTSAWAQASIPCTPSTTLAYVGDRDFPPYEYLDAGDRPAGFNIEVVQALAREMGVPIDIRLLSWEEARRVRESGGADLFSAGYVPARDEQFDFLAVTTTVRSSLLMRPGRASYPAGATDVKGLRIAIQDGTPSFAGFDALPPDDRPVVIGTPSHRASIALLAADQVDAVAGAGATLRWHAADAGLSDLIEMPVNSRPYMLGTRQGCRQALAGVTAAVERLKEQGVVDQIADRTLVIGPPGLRWRELVAVGIAGLAVVFIGVGWNWALRRTVRARTRALSTALAEQQRLTELIQSNEGRLAFAMDVIGEGVWEWDLAHDRIRASTRWAGSFGYRAEEAPKTYDEWMAYVHPEDRQRVAAAFRAHIEGRAPRFEATYRLPRKGGDWIWVVDRGRIVVRDEVGRPLRMVGTLRDITVQLAAERALHDAKEAAEANSNAKSAFLATISHEIRTPLNAIIGTAALLEHSSLTPDQRELLRLLKRSGDSLLAVVDDVLDFTKIEAGRIELDERPFPLEQTVRDSIGLVEHVARQKGLQLEVRMAPGTPAWVVGDDTRLRQILLNLLSNAVKFTETGGVTVTVSAADAGGGRLQLLCAIADTGIGIPAHRMPRLFQPFSQVDTSTTRRFGGTGLGLAISQRLAELMGGTIDVMSQDGRGSTFTLRITCSRAEAPRDVLPSQPAVPAAPPALRVVLAEDNPVNQFVQRRMLDQLGYPCEVVENGADLVEAVERHEYDVALIDIQMPVMDGLEAARELRRRGFTRMRLVALTADVTTETREACLAAGIDEYLSKPLKLDALAAALSRASAAVTA